MGSIVATTRLEGLGAGRLAPGQTKDGAMHPEGYETHYRMRLPAWTPAARTIVIANVCVFVVQHLLLTFEVTDLASCLGVRADLVLKRLWVWQVFTYMFLHGGVGHILFNMLSVYIFGTMAEHFLGRRRFLVLYFGGGVAGGLTYCATQYLAGRLAPAIGASAAVMAVLVVCAIYFPDVVVLFIPLKWVVIILVGVDLLYSIGPRLTGVAHTAHLGGALFGYLFWRFYPAAKQFLDRMEDRKHERRAERLADDERRLDELLAKIGREGIQSLTRGERAFLDEMSRRRRDRGYRE